MGGIQVEPKTFKSLRPEVLFIQKILNLKWGHRVWFLFYNNDESFEDLDSLIDLIKKIY